ncbi:hypothetical protein Aperf_G00000025463 [Anoplocephala perfoliata]
MSATGCLFSGFRLCRNSLHNVAYCSRSVCLNGRRLLSSLGDALVDPKKNSVSANVDIVNYSLAGCYIVGYNEHGFMLSNSSIIYGPMVSFPQNAFSWNVTSAKDINEESISLFRVLCPELEILIIGKGAVSEEANQREIMNLCWKYNLGVEIMPTPSAIGVFNFLNSEYRYVAAALIPPIRIDLFDSDKSSLKQLEAVRDRRLITGDEPKIKKLPLKEPSNLLKPPLKDEE